MSKQLFRLLAIKPLRPSFNEIRHDDLVKVERIHKALWNQNYWHYFYTGFDIDEDNNAIVANRNSVAAFSIFDTDSLKVSVCAVVGKNGKGKSSLVDLFIRLMNNLSTALMGEGYNFAAAEHLHFIDNVFASLAFQIGSSIYILEERGRKITLSLYKRTRNSGYTFNHESSIVLLDEPNFGNTRLVPLKKNAKGRRILKSLFYTMVCNYSLYGFNYKEYATESTPHERILALDSKNSGNEADEMHSWLRGIFHKNDGYQTPIVLHPMRNDGKLDVNKENHLANERLAALLFYVDANGNRPFRQINDLEVIAISLKPSADRRYVRGEMLNTLNIGSNRNISKNFDGVYNSILGFWDSKYDILSRGVNRPYKEDACDYIVYKTLKIISNYKKYTPIRTFLSRQDFDRSELPDVLRPLSEDYSHVTKKLLQAINYLRFDIYNPEHVNVNLNNLDQSLEPYFSDSGLMGTNKMLRATLLPPPIFDTDIILCHPDHNDTIPFDRLSSGERQFAYTISNFLYHLVNIDSAWSDYYRDKDHLEVIKYHYVNVIFDEVELYFHPDMQRKFVSNLMQSLQSVKFSSNLRGVNIILATHSPFILSDIPASNILCLGEENQNIDSSFGENIISLLSKGFFMDSTIGELARLQIEDVVTTYYKMREGEEFLQHYKDCRHRFLYLTKIVGEKFLRDMILRMVSQLETVYRQSIE